MYEMYNGMHAAFNEEIHDLREKMTSFAVNISRSSYVYEDGSVVIPSLYDDRRIISKEYLEDSYLKSFDFLIGDNGKVDDSAILRINDANKKLLSMYASMFANETGSFYGMIIVDGDKKFNPLHPIISMMIVAGEIQLSDSFTIIVYPYKSIEEDFDTYLIEEFASEITELIVEVRETQRLPNIYYRTGNSLETDIKNSIGGIEHLRIPFIETGDRVETAIIPVQLATTSIVYPYYGLILSRGGDGEQYRSRNKFPLLSGNINTGISGAGDTCVGELNSSSFTSLYVLSNMNTNSMFGDDVIGVTYKEFIQACQNVSAEILSVFTIKTSVKKGKQQEVEGDESGE